MTKAAIVIGGAVAKGAFAAGALSILLERLAKDHVEVVRLVGTSSGALNAVFVAAGIRANCQQQAAQSLVELWKSKARMWGFLEIDVVGAATGKGFSSMDGVVALLAKEVPDSTGSRERRDVSVRVVLSQLAGHKDAHPRTPCCHTTFEAVEKFKDGDFEDKARRSRMFRAAAASATFPGVFEPTEMDGLGACLDGGLVNNTPIGEALEDTPEALSRIYVISAEPKDLTLTHEGASDLSWLGLLQRLSEVVIYERLSRDLKNARKLNEAIRQLEALKTDRVLNAKQLAAVYDALNWKQHRELEIIEIRPEEPLPGHVFKGFLRKGVAEKYITAGEEAAKARLSQG